MVVVNQTSRVPPVDTERRERLAAAFDRDGVVGAMLIGSQARGEPQPLSDVDIAVWHAPGLDSTGRFRLRLDLIAAADAALGTEEIDLIMLNDAPPLLRQRAMEEGIRLLERDRDERVRLETKAIIDFRDTAPLREQLGEALRRRGRDSDLHRPGRSDRRRTFGSCSYRLRGDLQDPRRQRPSASGSCRAHGRCCSPAKPPRTSLHGGR